jgi:hypothetical protein
LGFLCLEIPVFMFWLFSPPPLFLIFLHMPGKFSTYELHPQPLFWPFSKWIVCLIRSRYWFYIDYIFYRYLLLAHVFFLLRLGLTT